MNTTPFMDKQIMDLTHGSSTNKDFIDLMKQEPHHHLQDDEEQQDQEQKSSRANGITKDDILPSYDFLPIRPPNHDSAPNFAAAFSRPWNSDSISPPLVKSYSSLDSAEPAKVIVEKDRSAFDATMLSEIDRTMKKHMENMLHVLEGVSARLTQLETRTHHLENSVDDLKVSVGNNHGSTDGKLRQLENILQEVQSGVQTIKDKQDIVQAQLQLAKLQVSKTQSEKQPSAITDPAPQAASAPVQSQQQLPTPANLPQSIPAVPPPNAPPQQGLPAPVQIPNQYSQNQIPAAPQRDTYFPPPQEAPNQQYQLPLSQQPHPQPVAPPHQQYQQTPHPQYPQPPPHLPQQQPPSLPSMNPPQPQLQSSLSHHVEEPPYVPPQSYPPNARQPPSHGASGYPQLPTARLLPQAIPTASAVSGSSGSAGTGGRVSIDDVVDKVASMGFPRDHVRATVRKLTENGQAVDLNAVLDKLMNDGEVQPPRGWFGR
uniref:DUF1421 domain-containing protein n=1 Tax=Cajanus cajan TaxID=3821 RepID=A0A151SJ63_CAJCA|nr:hypothetical protein KK1_001042 [Cajanus cajan]